MARKTFEFTLTNNGEVRIEGNKLIITCDKDKYSDNHTILDFSDANGAGWLRCSKNGIMSVKRIQ